MAKIGRNEPCPCRSGKKYKKCCGLKKSAVKPMSPEQALKITLMGAVEDIQVAAEAKRDLVKELGVFYFYATAEGDAWLLEMTDCDCVQLAQGGKRLEVPIDENPETIEINWSHTFAIRDKQLEITAYSDDELTVLGGAPCRELGAAVRRIRKKFSPEELAKVHLSSEPA